LAILPARAASEIALHSFASPPRGAYPAGRAIRDAAGNLYGTTKTCMGSLGVVYKLDTSGHQTVLHSFTDSWPDGNDPYAGVVRDPSGNLYGTTYSGGTAGGRSVEYRTQKQKIIEPSYVQ